MVGFGSSLRKARRTGWEGAYLDYETLKLLLSQIEAVYEEEGHWQFRHHHHHQRQRQQHHHSSHSAGASHCSRHRGRNATTSGGAGDDVIGTKSNGINTGAGGDDDDGIDVGAVSGAEDLTDHSSRQSGPRRGGTARDYRDELFLESNSDVAFASSASDVLSPSFASSGDEEFLQRRVMLHHHHGGGGVPNMISSPMMVDSAASTGGAIPVSCSSKQHQSLLSQTQQQQQHQQQQSMSSSKPFSLSYSREPSSTEEEEESGTCGGVVVVPIMPSLSSWVLRSTSNNNADNNNNKSDHHHHHFTNKRKLHAKKERMATAAATAAASSSASRRDVDSDYYVRSAPETFLIDDSHRNEDDDDEDYNDYGYTHAAAGSSGPYHHHLQQQPFMDHNDEEEGFKLSAVTPPSSSLLKAPFHQQQRRPLTAVHEQTALLGRQATTPPQAYYFGHDHHIHHHTTQTPPRNNGGNRSVGWTSTFLPHQSPFGIRHQDLVTSNTTSSNPNSTVTTAGYQQQQQQQHLHHHRQQTQQQQHHKARYNNKNTKWDMERRKQRRQRRARRKRELEKRVPRHIRIAHSKARAITERFLGLLRAEVEKCTLFAQSRLGELADTAGSLRFPYLDDNHINNNSSSIQYGSFGSSGVNGPRGTTTYEYPLSDGGMHPSASSSDEDGDYAVSGHGLFPWSDSSDDDDSSNANKSSSMVTTGSGAGGIPIVSSDAHHHHHHGTNVAQSSGRDQKLPKSSSHPQHDGSSGHHQSNKKQDGFEAAQRQIAHFEELRRNQPIFQRNDRIVGEDLLLISAVDEADGYTAVGVELLHVLRYVCLNMIAVRKICRKHDRLLMNRMLGGYYHRKQQAARTASVNGSAGTRKRKTKELQQGEDVITLGGILTHASGDVHYTDNHYKLEGVYDVKIQHLASSTTVEGIASCLALALSEYEVSRSRADAIANLKDNSTPKRTGGGASSKRHWSQPSPSTLFGTPPKGEPHQREQSQELHQQQQQTAFDHLETGESSLDGAPCSSSSISIARLRFTVVSIYALREAARIKLDPFDAYLARSLMAFSGHSVVGEGLEGCSRDTLDFLVAYNPDASLLLDSTNLYNGLRRGNWRKCPISQVMVASLTAAATAPLSAAIQSYSVPTEQSVMRALSVLPQPQQQHMDWPLTALGCQPSNGTIPYTDFGNVAPVVLQLQRMAVLLFNVSQVGREPEYVTFLEQIYLTSRKMNYFVAHATANTFVKAVGAQPAHSAAVIGITNIGAIVAAASHCYLLSRQPYLGSHLLLNLQVFKKIFLASAFLAMVGNVICALAMVQGSVPLAVLGRFLIGMGSAEIVHRQLIARCLPAILVVSESACYVQFQVMGRIIGIFTGALSECVPLSLQGIGVRSLQSSSWLMALLWLVHWIRVLVRFKIFVDPKASLVSHELDHQLSKDEDDSSSSNCSSDDKDVPPSKGMKRSSSRNSADGRGRTADVESARKSASGTDLSALRIRIVADSTVRRRRHPLKTIVIRVGKVLMYKVAIPVAMIIVVCTASAQEVLFSSCAVVTDQYFQWSGAAAGVFLGSLMALFLPVDYICENISRRYEERTVIKRAISIVCFGFFIMINWSAITSVLLHIRSAFSNSQRLSHPPYYDWKVGLYQYLIGCWIVYGGTVALEGATLSLLSKVSLAVSKNPVLNMATLVTFFTLLARTIGDVHILIVGLSDLIINTDIINSLVVPLLALCLVAGVLIRRHFFFLM